MIDVERLLEPMGLKQVLRAGWVRNGIVGPESVAAHSWGVAWLVLALAPPGLDRARALAYAVLHDLPEVRVGDITPADGVPADAKARLELAAANALLPPALLALYAAYERQDDPEARFVRELDRVDMALQALAYARAGHDTREFLDSADRFVVHAALRPVIEAIRAAWP